MDPGRGDVISIMQRHVESADAAVGMHAEPPCMHCHLAPECLPARLAPRDIAHLGRAVHSIPTLERHQVLYADGETAGLVFIVRSGCIRTSMREASGDDQVMEFHLPGEAVGFAPWVDGTHDTRAIALERSNVCSVRRDDLRTLAVKFPALQAQVDTLFERAMAARDRHLLMLGRRNATQRIALFLHTWGQRRRATGFSGVELHLPMGRNDLADYLGLVPETASRSLSRLQQGGIIRLHGRYRLTIADGEALASSAAFVPAADDGATTAAFAAGD